MTPHDLPHKMPHKTPRKLPPEMPPFLDERGHVPAAEMARYIDGTCDRDARTRLTRHLADCEECREELTALRRLVPASARSTKRFGAILGAAAAVALITLSWRGTVSGDADSLPTDGTRATAALTEIDAPFPVAFPATDALVSTDSVRLTWHSAGADAAYGVLLQDESGDVIYSTETSDTSVVVPATALASRDARAADTLPLTYLWRVDARLSDGRSAKTGVHRFRVR